MRSLVALLLIFRGFWSTTVSVAQDYVFEVQNPPSDLASANLRLERDSPGYCPDGWRAFGEHCYKEFGVSVHEFKSWRDASNHCQTVGANLTSVHSEKEQAFLNTFAFDMSSNLWIGLRHPPCFSFRTCSSVTFQWSDNSPLDYVNWIYRPNENGERCAYMMDTENEGGQRWRATSCTDKLAFICRKPKDQSLRKPGNDPSVCVEPEGWVKVKSSCYNIFSGGENYNTWAEAESSCNTYAGNLASVKNIRVALHLQLKMEELEGPFWIGVMSGENHEYTWLGREPLLYTNWLGGQPINVSDNANCVAMDINGKWILQNCNERRPFICEVREEVPTVSPPHPSMTCPVISNKWKDFGGKYCYIIETKQEFSKQEATTLCCREGGSVASIHSLDETNVLLHHTGHASRLHIGLWRNSDGHVTWDDGSVLDFVNWDSSASALSYRTEKCAVMHPSGRWNAVTCSAKYGYVCSTPKVPKVQNSKGALDDSAPLPTGNIVLIVITCLVLTLAFTGLAYYYFYHSKRTKTSDEPLVWNMEQQQ